MDLASRRSFFLWLQRQSPRLRDLHAVLERRAATASIPAVPPRQLPGGAPGFNLVGMASSELGLGQHLRNLAEALAAAGYPLRVVDVSWMSDNARGDRPAVGCRRSLRAGWPTLFVLNPDVIPLLFRYVGRELFDHGYAIGVWNWELPEMEPSWRPFAGLFHELWSSSAFSAAAIARGIGRPVAAVPIPIPVAALAAIGREVEPPAEGSFRFLCMFDMRSVRARKNPDAVLSAYLAAFPRSGMAELTVKVMNGSFDPPALAELERLAAERADIRILDRVMTRDEVYRLIAAHHCLVSLHRSEGFGLCLAEAMAIGRPVIATAWSANVDFMDAESAVMIGYDLVRLAADAGPYRKGSTWAEARIGEAAAAMVRLAADPAAARHLGRRAADRVASQLSPAAVGALITAHMGRGAAPSPAFPEPYRE